MTLDVGKPLRLNVGSGDVLREDCVNVDIRPVADVVADCRALPYADGSADELFAFDVLEHLPASETQTVLAEWFRVLRPGGRLTVRVPNLHALAVQIVYWHDKPTQQINALIQNIYGAHKWSEFGDVDVHHTGWTPSTLAVALSEAGFTVTANDMELNCTATAVKP